MALKLIMWMSVRSLMPMIGSKKKYDKRSPVYRSFGVEIAQNLSLNSFQGSKSSQIATLIFFTRQLSTTGQPTYQIPSFPTHISRLVLHSLPSQKMPKNLFKYSLKITQNVTFEFLKLVIFHQVLSYFKNCPVW